MLRVGVWFAVVGLLMCDIGGTGATVAAQGRDIRASVVADGRERTYLVHLPPGYDGTRAAPLVLLLHGAGGDGAGTQRLSGFDAVADANGLIAVYPDGVGRRWAHLDRGATPGRERIDDVAFIAALLDRLAAEYVVDAARVYVAGISNGGFMTERLACDLPERFAAVGVVASAVTGNLAATCPASGGRVVPVVFMHGTGDPLIPVAGGAARDGEGTTFLSTADSVAFWATRNGCGAPPIVTALPPGGDGVRVERRDYPGCRDGADVVFYRLDGAGHIWPGGPQYLPERFIGKATDALDGSAALWEFFAAHPKG